MMKTLRTLCLLGLLTVSICRLWARDVDSTLITNSDYSQTDIKMGDLGLVTDAAPIVAEYPEIKIERTARPYWTDLLRARRLDVSDTTVVYPKFIDICLRIYRWAENTFNTYDPEYVSGTGKHGKVRLVNDNWTDTYYFRLPEGVPLVMVSSPATNIGIAANYSILSASYMVDLKSSLAGRKSNYEKMQFAFTSARLYGEVYYWKNRGKTRVRFVGKENLFQNPNNNFDGVNYKELGLTGLYMFNSRKFSLAAAYNLSNYQLKSAGSPLLGISATFYDCQFDFSRLPDEVKNKIDLPMTDYKIECNSFDIIAGYSYNWVLNKHFLYNITAMPALGLTFTYSNSTMGRRCLLSLLIRGQMSLTYTTRQFFVTMAGQLRGNTLLTNDVRSMSGVGDLQVSLGVRF